MDPDQRAAIEADAALLSPGNTLQYACEAWCANCDAVWTLPEPTLAHRTAFTGDRLTARCGPCGHTWLWLTMGARGYRQLLADLAASEAALAAWEASDQTGHPPWYTLDELDARG